MQVAKLHCLVTITESFNRPVVSGVAASQAVGRARSGLSCMPGYHCPIGRDRLHCGRGGCGTPCCFAACATSLERHPFHRHQGRLCCILLPVNPDQGLHAIDSCWVEQGWVEQHQINNTRPSGARMASTSQHNTAQHPKNGLEHPLCNSCSMGDPAAEMVTIHAIVQGTSMH